MVTITSNHPASLWATALNLHFFDKDHQSICHSHHVSNLEFQSSIINPQFLSNHPFFQPSRFQHSVSSISKSRISSCTHRRWWAFFLHHSITLFINFFKIQRRIFFAFQSCPINQVHQTNQTNHSSPSHSSEEEETRVGLKYYETDSQDSEAGEPVADDDPKDADYVDESDVDDDQEMEGYNPNNENAE